MTTPRNATRPRHPLRTVLIGTSLEGESDAVVRSGLALARAAGARVFLVHAAQPGTAGPGAGEEPLRQQAERLGIAPAELAGIAVQAGAPHRVLVEAAPEAGAGLIVVGATGSGPFAAELLGSTADRVLRKATVPVLVIRGELKLPLRRVLAPVDLSTLSGDAFRCGLDVLSRIVAPDAGIRTVYAVGLLETLADRGDESYEAASRRIGEEAAGELRRFVLENGPDAPVHLETAVLHGEARFEILADLEKHPADLVVLGTHGRGGMDRLILGSVASTVARKAPCSVLMISPEAALGRAIAEAVEDRFTPVI